MATIVQRECSHHGITDFVLRSNGAFRCKKCAVDSVIKRRRLVKVKAIAYKGGKCLDCGLESMHPCVYDFHHDSGDKDFGISTKGFTRSWEKVKEELEKCVLLCSNCHRIRHAL